MALFLFSPCIGVYAAGADTLNGLNKNLGNVKSSAGFGSTSAVDIVAGIVQVVLGLLGVFFLVLLIWAGFIWMNAQGEESKVEEAKNRITQSIIGLLIVLASYAISYFVVSSIQKAVGAG